LFYSFFLSFVTHSLTPLSSTLPGNGNAVPVTETFNSATSAARAGAVAAGRKVATSNPTASNGEVAEEARKQAARKAVVSAKCDLLHHTLNVMVKRDILSEAAASTLLDRYTNSQGRPTYSRHHTNF
jgi:phosphoribosyl-ATP pyrophosphohydrolase